MPCSIRLGVYISGTRAHNTFRKKHEHTEKKTKIIIDRTPHIESQSEPVEMYQVQTTERKNKTILIVYYIYRLTCTVRDNDHLFVFRTGHWSL